MHLLLITFLVNISLSHGFDGRIKYEIQDIRNAKGSKQELTISIKKHKIIYDFGTSEKYISDFKEKNLYVLTKNSISRYDLDAPYDDKDFINPEEILSVKQKKTILGFETEEFETYYFSKKVRLPIKAWYAPGLDVTMNVHSWNLNLIDENFGFLNYLVNPVTKKIALELIIRREDRTTRIFKAKSIERANIPDNEFETFSREGLLHFEGINSANPKKKFYLILALDHDIIRFNLTSRNTSSLAPAELGLVLNFKNNTFTSKMEKEVTHETISNITKLPNFSLPSEPRTTNNTTTILDLPTEEFLTTYTEGDKKLSASIWYSPSLYFKNFSPAQNIYDIAPSIGLFNLFIHPVTKQVALKATIKYADETETTFNCIKWENIKIPDEFFNLDGKTYR